MTETVRLLLVDDDAVDVMAVRRAFKKQRIANPIVVARDGVEALEILRGTPEQPPLQRPFLILLDLNMPRMSGLEFLREIRSDDDHCGDVVFVLTTSDDSQDLQAAYREHIAGYIVKSRIGEDFLDLVSLLEPYWRIVELVT